MITAQVLRTPVRCGSCKSKRLSLSGIYCKVSRYPPTPARISLCLLQPSAPERLTWQYTKVPGLSTHSPQSLMHPLHNRFPPAAMTCTGRHSRSSPVPHTHSSLKRKEVWLAALGKGFGAAVSFHSPLTASVSCLGLPCLALATAARRPQNPDQRNVAVSSFLSLVWMGVWIADPTHDDA
jgi:hypothetical protein